MEIISYQVEDLKKHGKNFPCNVHSIHAKVSDINGTAANMIISLSDKSWIDNLGVVEKITFTANAEKTIEKIVEKILKKVDNKVTADFGEFLISETAGLALKDIHSHIKFPIAELWKSRITGNDGFDFHTESKTDLLCFGEAKFSSSHNPYPEAISQINSFIKDKKDDSELLSLSKFCRPVSIDNYSKRHRAYVIAFSLRTKNSKLIFKNIIKSIEIDNLFVFPELYIIGIEI